MKKGKRAKKPTRYGRDEPKMPGMDGRLKVPVGVKTARPPGKTSRSRGR